MSGDEQEAEGKPVDYGIIGGIVAGIAMMLIAIVSAGGTIGAFFDLSSVLITVGGTIASTFVHFKPDQMRSVLKLVRIAMSDSAQSPRDVIRLLVHFAGKARREGLLALEEEAEQLDDAFLRKGLQLVVDGTDPETVRQILDIEVTFLEERHQAGQRIFEHMGAVAPAFGMVGTLIGLIIMLGRLDDPSSIGPAMAVALITTLYGVVLSNLVFIPIAGKLKVKSEEEVLLREVMIEGILSIQAGENPHIVEQKLESFLPPKVRGGAREAEERAEQGAERMVASGAR